MWQSKVDHWVIHLAMFYEGSWILIKGCCLTLNLDLSSRYRSVKDTPYNLASDSNYDRQKSKYLQFRKKYAKYYFIDQ